MHFTIRQHEGANRPSPPPVFPAHGRHIPALDALRGLAILLVLVYHVNLGLDDPSWLGAKLGKVLKLGGCGVDLFFVLSGFLITGILHDAKGDPYYFRNFYVRRTLRIFPLYYAVLVFAFVLLPMVSSLGSTIYREAAHDQGWLWLYGANVLIGLKSSYGLGGFNHFWSLAVEEHFYLFWPLVIYAFNRRGAMLACVACIVLSTVSRVWLMSLGDNGIACYVLTPCRMDSLTVGAWLALAVRGPMAERNVARWAALSLAASLVATAVFLGSKQDLTHMDATVLVLRPTFFSWVFASLLMVAVCARPGGLVGRLGRGQMLRFLGKYSYGLYIFHYPLIPLLQHVYSIEDVASKIGSLFLARLGFVALEVGGSVALALLSWNLMEKHCVKLKDVLTRRPNGEERPGVLTHGPMGIRLTRGMDSPGRLPG
jgi:peptidoglycan/LPS O-acetylase OafA/YrhL